jgi:hypothetical protein
VSGAGPSPAAELRSAYSFGVIALTTRRTPRFRLRAPTRVMAVGRDGEAGRRTWKRRSSPFAHSRPSLEVFSCTPSSAEMGPRPGQGDSSAN